MSGAQPAALTLASMSRLRPGRRTFAILAIVLLFVVAASDFFVAGFWLSHPMLTAIVSALVVVLLSVAVIEVVLSRRSERRWRVLAQTALMELGEAANTTWSKLGDALDLQGASGMSPDQVQGALASGATGPKVRREIEAALMSSQLRENLAGQLAERLADGHQIMGRWAIALTASETMPRSSISTSSSMAGSMACCGSCVRGIDKPIRAGSEAGLGGSTRRLAGRPKTSGSSITSSGPSRSAPASRTRPGTWRCMFCPKRGGIAVLPSSPQPPGLLAPIGCRRVTRPLTSPPDVVRYRPQARHLGRVSL
jgi:hypothetical protein